MKQYGCIRATKGGRMLASGVAALLAVVAFPAAAGAVTATSTFNTTVEGWQTLNKDCSGPPTGPSFSASNGNPGGFMFDSDTETIFGGGEQCFWFAVGPASFAGDLRGNYGGTISFDIRPATTAANTNPEVAFASPAGQLVKDAATIPAVNVWTHYSFTIDQAAGWFFASDTVDPRPATLADMFAVLTSGAQTDLLGDLVNGDSNKQTGFDNISLTNAPTPLDSDGDGVTNTADNCPAVSGPPSNSGCPIPPDGDGDGTPDATDLCPTQFGPPSNNGCPTTPANPDPDGDGLIGTADHCPDQAGPASNDGCPKSADNAACDDAKAKLDKAKAKLKKLKQHNASKQAIAKAKKKVKKAKAAVADAC